MKEDRKLSNEEKIKAVEWWQNQEFFHPLTCVDSCHGKLLAREIDGLVELYCEVCNYIQKNIPKTVYDMYLFREGFREIWNIRRKNSLENPK